MRRQGCSQVGLRALRNHGEGKRRPAGGGAVEQPFQRRAGLPCVVVAPPHLRRAAGGGPDIEFLVEVAPGGGLGVHAAAASMRAIRCRVVSSATSRRNGDRPGAPPFARARTLPSARAPERENGGTGKG